MRLFVMLLRVCLKAHIPHDRDHNDFSPSAQLSASSSACSITRQMSRTLTKASEKSLKGSRAVAQAHLSYPENAFCAHKLPSRTDNIRQPNPLHH